MRRLLVPVVLLLLGAPALVAAGPVGADAERDGARPFLVRFGGPIEPAWRDAVLLHARAVHDHVPPFSYLAHLDAAGRAALRARPEVVAVEPFGVEGKWSARLPDDGEARVEALALAFPQAGLDEARALAAASGLRVLSATPTAREHVLRLEGPVAALRAFAAHDAVRWVEPDGARHAGFDNAPASSLVQDGTRGTWSVHARGVDGGSQTVAACDSGVDTDAPLGLGAGRAVHALHADPLAPLVQNQPSGLHRKIWLYYAPVEHGLRGDLDDALGHGTHTMGTLAGDAGAWGARDGHDGVAYAARLVVCDIATGGTVHVLDDYARYWAPAYEAGARVHANSWGTDLTGEYGVRARQHDAYVWDHPDLLILRSMGNAGPGGAMRQEAAAKNVLAVGATREPSSAEPAVADFSARGPAADGRVKPDLVAPGDCVTSGALGGPHAHACLGGTSMSTAVAAGAAALVRDYYQKGHHPTGRPEPADGFSPSAALVRATLVAGARLLPGTTPDGAQGWGRVTLDDALFFEGEARTLRAIEGTAQPGGWSVVAVTDGTAPLRVALAWTDHPAAPGASPALVNDLDLVVARGQDARTCPAPAAPDRRNTAEVVELPAADAPVLTTVCVRAAHLPMGPQPFAVVVLEG